MRFRCAAPMDPLAARASTRTWRVTWPRSRPRRRRLAARACAKWYSCGDEMRTSAWHWPTTSVRRATSRILLPTAELPYAASLVVRVSTARAQSVCASSTSSAPQLSSTLDEAGRMPFSGPERRERAGEIMCELRSPLPRAL